MKLLVFYFLIGFMVLLSEQQGFPYHQFQSRLAPSWKYLEAFSDSDLYSYILARRFGLPINSPYVSRPNAFLKNNEPIIIQNMADKTENLNVQSRNKGVIQQLPDHQEEPLVNPRFLFNYVATIGSTINNPLQKTIYYFTTTTSTTTFTSTCITSTVFAAQSSTIICRKRRDLLEVLSVFDKSSEEIEKPAEILPSNVQQVMPTEYPTTRTEQPIELVSSMEEKTLSSNDYPVADAASRVKRFFVTTTIVTTYVFSTVTTIRTLSANLLGVASLLCRPSQFSYC